jgi:FkbM family methyltransferase
MNWKGRIQQLGHRVGVHVDRWPPRSSSAGGRRQLLLEWLAVDVLFDVGANAGQYASAIRNWGYKGQIVSFEPVAAAFRELEVAAQNDPRWAVRHIGLGERGGEAEINVSAGTQASSVLPMAERHVDLFPQERYVGTERIRIETLDSASAEFLEPSACVAVKLDVQGYEMNVLRGGAELLRRASMVESEMDFVELYNGQAGFEQLVDILYEAGLRLASLEPGHVDTQTGALVWGDGIFVRDR